MKRDRSSFVPSVWAAAATFALGAASASAECPDGKIEVVRTNPAGKTQIICVSPNAQGGQQTAGGNSAGTIVIPAFTPVGVVRDSGTGLPTPLGPGLVGDLTADGSMIVGTEWFSDPSHTEAYLWTEAGIELLSPGVPGQALGISADGTVVVGWSHPTAGGVGATVWAGGGVSGLDCLEGDNGCYANDVSSPGNVIVGVSERWADSQAFRWTAAEGMEGLGLLDDQPTVAYGVSADGSVVVGGVYTKLKLTQKLTPEAFRWTPEGMSKLSQANGFVAIEARGVSDDGEVVVGWGSAGEAIEAFRWTAPDGAVGLGLMEGQTYLTSATRAYAVSGDGNVVVGGSVSSASGSWENEAFRWTLVDGMQSVAGLLEAHGVDLTGWTLTGATAVSSDGTVIAGVGINPEQLIEGWRATLPLPTEAPVTEVSCPCFSEEEVAAAAPPYCVEASGNNYASARCYSEPGPNPTPTSWILDAFACDESQGYLCPAATHCRTPDVEDLGLTLEEAMTCVAILQAYWSTAP